MVTGESIPVDKGLGDMVIGATPQHLGSFEFVATQSRLGNHASSDRATHEDAQGSKAPIQAFADRVAAWFVPVVLGIAAGTFIIWYFILGKIL